MRHITSVMLMLVLGVGTGCSISSVASDPRGVKGVDGDHLTHINTRNYAVHLFMTKPIWGDATLSQTVQSFADEAKKHGATKIRIVQSDETSNVVSGSNLGVHFYPGGHERRGRWSATVDAWRDE